MAKLKMDVEVDVLDEDICKGCKKFQFNRVKTKNAYEQDVEVIQCKNKELCQYLLEQVAKNNFLHK